MEPASATAIEEPEESEEPEAPPPKDPDTVFQETAAGHQIEDRRGRGHHKEASAGFFAKLSQYPKDDWEKLLLYIYRMAPITDRRASGEPVNYIAKLSEPIDEDYVLREPNWGGSGKYRVRLNKLLPDGKNTPIDVVEFVVENKKYPPQVPPGEWVDDPRNKRWAWAKTYYDGKMEAANPAPPPPPPPAGPSIGELIQGVKSLKELTQEAAPPPPPPAPDPVAQLKGTIEAVRSMVEMSKPPAAEKGPDANAQFENTLKLVTAIAGLMKHDPAPAPAAPLPDPLRDLAIAMLTKRLEKLDDPPPAAAETAAERQSRMNGTQELIVEVSKHAMPVLDRAIQLIMMGMAAKQQQPQPRPTPKPKATDAPAVEQAQPQPQQESPATPEPVAEQVDPRKAVLNFILSYVTPTLITYLEENDGEEFAAWFCNSSIPIPNAPFPIPGIKAHEFAKQFGRLAIMEAYKTNPTLYQQIAPNTEAEEKFIRFLDEFLQYDPKAIPDDEGDDD